jgi:uncharacterized lipoprotein YmbA
MKMRITTCTVAIAAMLLSAGCLFRATEAPRFYRPASTALDADVPPEPATDAPVRLGSVESAPFLRERIVWRASDVEYGLYEQRRWFELPTRYIRRALSATLGTTPGLRFEESASAPHLDVELLAFDEILAPEHEAHVAIEATLHDGPQKRFERTFSARVPIATGEGPAMAASMGKALDEVVQKIATATASALGTKKPAGHPHRGK